jgi:hypothetical protein
MNKKEWNMIRKKGYSVYAIKLHDGTKIWLANWHYLNQSNKIRLYAYTKLNDRKLEPIAIAIVDIRDIRQVYYLDRYLNLYSFIDTRPAWYEE